ncbi:hypothetical protein [Brevibacillus sp. IT-7CA2]|uniref:hypothetical protein n=1 Tax=Brevibacillus sp. IT-7CA2 TaxID=3026436 RepID=UPI0039E15824
MPELGSKVKLYFPSTDEDDGMVMNSVRTVRQAFPTILSAFEKDVQENGLAAVMLPRTVNNQVAEAKGKIDALGDTLLGLWNVVVDAGDIASTVLPTTYLVDAIYEGVTGEERPSLLERNDLARGAVEGATNAVNYVGDTVTGNKSWEQIKSDAKSFGQGLYDDYIDPFVKDAQYDQDNLFKGGLWTRSEEESYAKGQNEFKKDMVVAEVAVSALSAGTGTAVTRTVKMANKLDGPNGKKKSGDHEGNGKGVLLPNSSIDDAMSAMLKDGKLKTHGKSFAESMIELQEKVDKFLKQMNGVFNGRVVVLRDAVTGQPMVYWMRHDDLPGNGGGGGGNHRRRDGKEDWEREERERRDREERERREQEQRDSEGKGNVASYPSRTPEATAEAQNVVGELNKILGDGKRAPNPVVSVITHEDGTVSVGISGEASPKNIETARQLQNALNKKYGDKYTVKAEPMPTEKLDTIEGSNTAGTCAESKVVNAAHDNPSKITGMDTVWRSSKKENPYPYAEGSNQMNPCLTCSDIKNIEEYMKYANANKK